MLSPTHVAIALAQFLGAIAMSLLLVASLGLGVRAALLGNLATSLLLLTATAVAALSGTLSPNRRLLRLWPTAGILLVPVAFSGWSAGIGSSPDLLAVLHCSLPFAVLLALQSAVAVPALPPPASESPSSTMRCARAFTYLVLTLVFLLLLLAVAARFAAPLGMDGAYAGFGLVVPLFGAGYAMNAVHCALAPSLSLSERPALLAQLGAAAAALNLLLNLLLVPAFGALGAALSTLATFLALAAATFRASQRRFPVPYEYGRLAKILATAAIVYVAALRWPLAPSWTALLAQLSMTAVGFAIVLALSGFLRRKERQALRRLVPMSIGAARLSSV
jgi:O-antigen/teichoic acid export membrane protein